ncbi:MAG: exonuclease domain-containing protein [Sphingobacteriaceae bacterium]
MYAIVDIETTGGHASAHGITEVAVVIHDGNKVTERYQTLINPGMIIPDFIQSLTGITNEMVRNAPAFREVAESIFALLSDKVFVAHNVNFDYSFLHHHLAAAGFDLQCKKLCTVRLGRKIMPGLPSYSLGKLCRHLAIPNEGRHRAMGDADATTVFFSMLLNSDTDGHIETSLRLKSKEQRLPTYLTRETVDKLPQTAGVYYFHNRQGKVVYVGKAKNLKKRVNSHFTGTNPSRQRQEFLRHIHNITFQHCGTELIAFILEAIEIKRLWPAYNRSLKRFEQAFGLFLFEDQNGFLRLAVDKRKKYTKPVYSFNSLLEGYHLLGKLMIDFQLCPKLCFIQKNTNVCSGIEQQHCKGACNGKETPASYNHRVQLAIEDLIKVTPTFAIVAEGRTDKEESCILMEKGQFYGMGYINGTAGYPDLPALKRQLTAYPANEYIRNLVYQHANRFPEKSIWF